MKNENKEINNFLKENIQNKMKYLINKFNNNINDSILIYDINKKDNKIKKYKLK